MLNYLWYLFGYEEAPSSTNVPSNETPIVRSNKNPKNKNSSKIKIKTWADPFMTEKQEDEIYLKNRARGRHERKKYRSIRTC
jgi:hypothetical protein